MDSAGLTKRLSELADEYDVPGVSVAVLVDGDVTTAAAGVLNRETGVEATTDSLFQIGSQLAQQFPVGATMSYCNAGSPSWGGCWRR